MASGVFRRGVGAAMVALVAAMPVRGQCPDDLNADGQADALDLAVMLAEWGICSDGSACS